VKAADLVRAGKISEALAGLLALWRRAPHPAVGDAIERVSGRVPAGPLPETTAAWVRRARTARAEDAGEVTALLGSLRSRVLADVRTRLGGLRRLLPDPRVARALVELARAVPFTSTSSKEMWRELFELVAAAGDPRARGWLEGLFAKTPIRSLMRAFLDRQVAATLPKIASAPSGGPPDLTPLLAALGPEDKPRAPVREKAGTRDDLLAAVYANPDDDAPRLVLADHLIERGDPYGEVIAKQVRSGAAARDRRGKEWIGELARFVRADFELRRGFLSSAALKLASRDAAGWARDLPGWATVERIDLNTSQYTAQVLPLPRTLRALREISGVYAEHVPELVALKHLRLRAIAFRPFWLVADNRKHRSAWRELEASPIVSELERIAEVPPQLLVRSPLLTHLREATWSRGPVSAGHGALAARWRAGRVIVEGVVVAR
jgi:uncharacterized protein (TIGR02996 family)